MRDLCGVLGVLATVVLPMLLAWWLLGRPARRTGSRRDRHGKMPREDEH